MLVTDTDAGLSFVDTIMSSLRSNYDDFIFKLSDLNEIISRCAEEHISLIYEPKYDSRKNLDYVHLIPVKFYTNGLGNEDYQLERSKVPSNWHWRKLSTK